MFGKTVIALLLAVYVVVLLLFLQHNHNAHAEIDFESQGNAENLELRNFKENDISKTIVKRSVDNTYPKNVSSVNEKKQPEERTFIDLTNGSKNISNTEDNKLFLESTFSPKTPTTSKSGYHRYYNSTFYESAEQAISLLVDFETIPPQYITVNKLLSDSYKKTSPVHLSFDFPFYGHLLRNITITTAGFLYMGEPTGNWKLFTQYVAPLMANFDPSLKNESMVRYYDNGTAFTVQWYKVLLKDRESDGPFTFQVTLMKNGKIIFFYEKIPLSVMDISKYPHPVKVGISDAYILDRIVYFLRRKTIYEYSNIDMKRDEIGSFTAIMFTALPTCLTFSDCHSCEFSHIDFDCIWCDEVQRCSNGFDRYRQEWLEKNCNQKKEKINCGTDSTKALPSIEITNVINHTTEKYLENTRNPIKLNITSLPSTESTPESKYKINNTDGQITSSSATAVTSIENFKELQGKETGLPETSKIHTTINPLNNSNSSNLENTTAKGKKDHMNSDILEYLKRREENEKIRWEEYKKLEVAKIEAIYSITNAILNSDILKYLKWKEEEIRWKEYKKGPFTDPPHPGLS